MASVEHGEIRCSPANHYTQNLYNKHQHKQTTPPTPPPPKHRSQTQQAQHDAPQSRSTEESQDACIPAQLLERPRVRHFCVHQLLQLAGQVDEARSVCRRLLPARHHHGGKSLRCRRLVQRATAFKRHGRRQQLRGCTQLTVSRRAGGRGQGAMWWMPLETTPTT